ncbi:helix-turn-helix transcriptional regulator [Xanthomonas sp. LF06-19]|uniref:helix-turn-helix transcriptional regulator n=1 Tax=Xanthomonas sp. LF06-19 TaxID=3097551 RepID=UPI002A841BE7|nr:helix-turn-helix transcriptional regulator [Xanthomonas sp. LF06-19]MDY4282273.1 helix-turn-helix transcriptional regulator [Xanthomonas sp. LF06-19]
MHPPSNAGQWREALRRDAADAARWQAVAAAAAALREAGDAAQAAAHALVPASALVAAPHAAVLAVRGARCLVLASQGDALPPGASVAVEASAHAWRLRGTAATEAGELCLPIATLGVPLGMLCLGWDARTVPAPEDVQALSAIAALLAPLAAEPPRAPRRRKPAQADRLAVLSARERQVLALLSRGLTNAALGAELGISAGTAKVHVERILHKLQVADRTQAAVVAVQAGVAL